MAFHWECACGATGTESVAACPRCGSEALHLFLALEEHVGTFVDRLAARVEEAGQTVGFFETSREGCAIDASSTDTDILYSLMGSAPQGEADTLQACRILIAHLNEAGAAWTEPAPGTGVVDAQTQDAVTGQSMFIQVVRAVIDSSLWATLNGTGHVSRAQPIATLTQQLRDALEHKARLPPGSRRDLVLALDATRLPAACLSRVVEAMTREHGAWAASLGFAAVWIIGPQPMLTWRLA